MSKIRVLIGAVVVLTTAVAFGPARAASPPGSVYAIRGATLHTAAGAPIVDGTIVMRNGVIVAIGAGVMVPPDAIVIDGSGLNAYPGLIDLANDAPIDTGDAPPAAGGGGRGGGRGGGGTQQFSTREEAERAKRENLLRPDLLAADNLRESSDALTALAGAGITTALAVPSSGIFKGQSALVNVVLPPDDPQISNIADFRRGLAILKSPVAMHVDMGGRGAGDGYPQALLGTIAFTRQGLLDAQWQRDARAHYERSGRGPRPVYEPALDALAPALARQVPTAFDADEAREIDRALAMAAEFNLDPIIVTGAAAATRAAELKASGARVIMSLDFPSTDGRGGRGGGRGGRGGGGGAGPSLRQLKAAADAPKAPATLAAAGVPFGFSSGGLTPAEFVRNAGRVVSDGGLSADAALRALTIDAARIAGAADRTGSLEEGKVANVVVTSGDMLSGGQVRHVFVDGLPVDVTPPEPATGRGGRGRGGQR